MAAATPPDATPPAIATTPQAMGNLFQTYDPQGAMNGMFAPAYIRGFSPSEQAVQAWAAQNHPLTRADVDQTRMPPAYAGASPVIGADGVYGGGVPQTQVYGDPRGPVDPEALRVLAQGGKYDLNARRDAIAARLAANAAAQGAPAPAAAPAAPGRGGFNIPGYGGALGGAPSPDATASPQDYDAWMRQQMMGGP